VHVQVRRGLLTNSTCVALVASSGKHVASSGKHGTCGVVIRAEDVGRVGEYRQNRELCKRIKIVGETCPGDFIVKFVLGFVIGIVIGLLSAPAPGRETRQKLAEKARQLRQLPEEKVEQFAEATKERAGELGSRVGRQAAEAAIEAVRQDVLGKRETA
jgi:gas vesicle protein